MLERNLDIISIRIKKEKRAEEVAGEVGEEWKKKCL